MALRQIRVMGDEVLTKQCREVKEMTPRLKTLISDMFETMYDACGVGLAAPQVGILKRIFVVDTTGDTPRVFINPEIVETSGEQTGEEGCLSVPGKCAVELEATELLARAVLHENDHLDGHLYVEKAEGEIMDVE